MNYLPVLIKRRRGDADCTLCDMKIKILYDSLHRIITSVHLLDISICAPNMRGGGPPVKKILFIISGPTTEIKKVCDNFKNFVFISRQSNSKALHTPPTT